MDGEDVLGNAVYDALLGDNISNFFGRISSEISFASSKLSCFLPVTDPLSSGEVLCPVLRPVRLLYLGNSNDGISSRSAARWCLFLKYLSEFAVMASSKDWHLIFFAEKTYDQTS